MMVLEGTDLILDLRYIFRRAVDSKTPISFPCPASDIYTYPYETPLLLFNLFANLTLLTSKLFFVDQLHPAGFSFTIFFIAMPSKGAPSPVPAALFYQVKPTHGD